MRHNIRLAGPWSFRAYQTETDELLVSSKISWGDWDWKIPPEAGRLVFCRLFNRPTGLDETASFHWQATLTRAPAVVRLNGQPLTWQVLASSPQQFVSISTESMLSQILPGQNKLECEFKRLDDGGDLTIIDSQLVIETLAKSAGPEA